MIEIYHKDCGGLLGYADNSSYRKDSALSFTVYDGTKPNPGDQLLIVCSKCSRKVTRFIDMKADNVTQDYWS